MTTKITKTIWITSVLLLIAFIPIQSNVFGVMDTAQKVNEPRMVDLLNDMVQNTGKTVNTHTLRDSSIVTITNDVTKLDENKYQVHLLAKHQGKIVNEQTIIVTQKADGSVNMVNEREGFNVDFYKAANDNTLGDGFNGISTSYGSTMPQVLGTGSSDWSGAQIDLYKSGVKQPGQVLNLNDSYSGCAGANAGSFAGQVFSDLKTKVDWNANSLYWHWCISGHSFDHGKIVHEGQTFNLGSSDTSGTHWFTNTGTNPYSIDADYVYGNW